MLVLDGSVTASSTARATSSGSTIFSRGASGQNCCQMSVSTAPESKAITRIPFSRSSMRSVLVKPRAPDFDAL